MSAREQAPTVGKLLKRYDDALAAERALCDRLAEALSDCGEHQRGCPLAHFEAGRPTESGGYEMQYAGKWYEVKPNDCRPGCTCGLSAALAAHAERRKPQRNEILDHGDDVGADGMDGRKA